MSENKFTDTLNQLLDQLETVKTEIEKQNARMKQMEASNAELLEALEDCCVIAKPENPACCCPNYQPLPDGDCAENEDGECHIWKAIQKARVQG
jgi:hypothetical protein